MAASASGAASLSDVEHVVVLMQENRSFDQYFGTLSGVRGFSDPAVPTQVVDGVEFRSSTSSATRRASASPRPGTCSPSTSSAIRRWRTVRPPTTSSHSWATQHQSWNHGAMDSFVAAHLAADGADERRLSPWATSRGRLAFYHALADAFTICDGYHCSVLGPTDPNRLM